MFPNYCGTMGFLGWIMTLLIWSGMVALVVWGITKLFPGPPHEPPLAMQGTDATERVGVDLVSADPESSVVPQSVPLPRH